MRQLSTLAAVRLVRIINRPIPWARTQSTSSQLVQPLPSHIDIFFDDVTPVPSALMFHGSNNRATDPHVGVEHGVTFIGQGQDQPLHKLHRKLAGMNSFLNVIILYVRDHPHVSGILPLRIAGKLPPLRPLKVSLVGILRGDPNWVEIENIVVTFCEPHDSFVATRQSFRTMKTVLKVPDNPIP